jgi:tyrosinase
LSLEPLEGRTLLTILAAPPPPIDGVTATPTPLGGSGPGLEVRKNQSTLTESEKQHFVNAVKQLKQTFLPGSDLSVYDQFVQTHSNEFLSGQGHGGPAFLAWHREFLLQFEQALQSVDPTVTIPYWDFTVDNSPTSSLWADDFLGGNGDPTDNGIVKTGPFRQGQWTLVFDGPDLRRTFGLLVDSLPKPDDVANALSAVLYDTFPYDVGSPIDQSFRNNIEGFNHPTAEPELHNRVHAWVGGSMAIQYSPNDPVFWLLHADIDRLWAEWEDQTGQAYAPVVGAAHGHNLNDPMSPWGITPAEVVDDRALGYMYDTQNGGGGGGYAPSGGSGPSGRGGNGSYSFFLGVHAHLDTGLLSASSLLHDHLSGVGAVSTTHDLAGGPEADPAMSEVVGKEHGPAFAEMAVGGRSPSHCY